jgi:hypothetical protein
LRAAATGDLPMSDLKHLSDEIASLKRENAELAGLSLATGVILTQLLQTICARELNPQNATTKIMTNARNAVEGFTTKANSDPAMKKRALEAVKQYEDQIRSVLAI